MSFEDLQEKLGVFIRRVARVRRRDVRAGRFRGSIS